MISTPLSVFLLQNRNYNVPSQSQWREFDFLLRGSRWVFTKLQENIPMGNHSADTICNRDMADYLNKNSSNYYYSLLTKCRCFPNLLFSNPENNLECQPLLLHFTDEELGAQKVDILEQSHSASNCWSRDYNLSLWLRHCPRSCKIALTNSTVGFCQGKKVFHKDIYLAGLDPWRCLTWHVWEER